MIDYIIVENGRNVKLVALTPALCYNTPNTYLEDTMTIRNIGVLAVYSIISPEAEAQFTFEDNRYEKEEGLIVRWGDKTYLAENKDNPLK